MADDGNGRSNGNGSSEQHQNSPDPDRLKPFEFQSGQSGNPAGRPKGAKDGLRATLRKKLKAAPDGMMADTLKALGIDLTDKKNADAVVEMLLFKVARGDIQALKLAFDQTEEPLKHTVDLGGEIHHEHKLDLAACSPEELKLLESLGATSGPDS